MKKEIEELEIDIKNDTKSIVSKKKPELQIVKLRNNNFYKIENTHFYILINDFKKLNETDLKVDSFNISTWEYISSKNELPLTLKILRVLLFNYRLKLFVVKKAPLILRGLLKRYNVVDIHFFGTFYYKTIDLLIPGPY